MVASIMQMKKPRLKEIQSLVRGHTTSKWESRALHPFLSDLRAWALTHCAVGLPQMYEDGSRVVGARTKMPRWRITSVRIWTDTK